MYQLKNAALAALVHKKCIFQQNDIMYALWLLALCDENSNSVGFLSPTRKIQIGIYYPFHELLFIVVVLLNDLFYY